jgi:2,4-dienoyl-CoA reductase-like NADH-dependent reductase (Old Yellow Enzyme family)
VPQFRHLFEPITIGAHTICNRIVSTAHATGYDQDGLLTERYVRYHERPPDRAVLEPGDQYPHRPLRRRP